MGSQAESGSVETIEQDAYIINDSVTMTWMAVGMSTIIL